MFAAPSAPTARTLLARPDLRAAARRLALGLARCEAVELRIALLKRIMRLLGDNHYPVFVKILATIGQSDDPHAKRMMAETLAWAMQRNDLPSGSLTGWGSAAPWLGQSASFSAGSLLRAAPRRNFDPIAYLTAWYSQTTDRPRLSAAAYGPTLAALIDLFQAHPPAARAYRAKLSSDISHLPEGTFSEATRTRLLELVRDWELGTSSLVAAERAAAVEPRDLRLRDDPGRTQRARPGEETTGGL